MSQTSKCNWCGEITDAYDDGEGRAYYQCDCGRKWSTRAYYGEETTEDKGGYGGTGALVGLGVGGIPGAVVGGIVDAFIRDKQPLESQCIVCGSTGHPTGYNGDLVGFQCSNCYRTWTERR